MHYMADSQGYMNCGIRFEYKHIVMKKIESKRQEHLKDQQAFKQKKANGKNRKIDKSI